MAVPRRAFLSVTILAIFQSCGGGKATTEDVADRSDVGGEILADSVGPDDVRLPPDAAPGDVPAHPDSDIGVDLQIEPDLALDAPADQVADVPADEVPDGAATDDGGAADAFPEALDASGPGDVGEEETSGGDVESPPACNSMGLTWFQLSGPSPEGTVAVACGNESGACNPYVGDTACTESLPVLCVKSTGEEAPTGETPWFAGSVKISQPVMGCALTSLTMADTRCADEFGPGWRMAEWHDGSPGVTGSLDIIGQWTFSAFGDWTYDGRFWVYINDQPGNCFPTLPLQCCNGISPCAWGGPCVQGYCVNQLNLPPMGCYVDAQCPVGYTCSVGMALGKCEEGGIFEPGACLPIGPGGMCPVYPGQVFGDCGDELGYMWTGADCALVTGCDCGDYCAAMKATKEECVAACAPPICCTSTADCGSAKLQCHQGFCVSPELAAGTCWTDDDCGSMQACIGGTPCVCGGPEKCVGKPMVCPKDTPCPPEQVVYPGTCTYKPTCCGSDAGCNPGEACVPSPFGGGTCQPKPSEKACWTTADCATGEACAFAALCPCEVGCKSKPGVCTKLPDACCTADSDCPEWEICSAAPAGLGGAAVLTGQCVPVLGAGVCFNAAHCDPGEVCAGAQPWPCGMAGGVPYGTCAPGKNACCTKNEHCPEGLKCRGLPGFDNMSCQPDPGPGKCWAGGDCSAGMVCKGMNMGWGCGPDDYTAKPGVCVAAETLGCCTKDEECGPGQACTAKKIPGAGDFPDATQGQCVPDPAEWGCLNNGDCPPEMACTGTPGWPCGKPAGAPGWCANPADMCCDSDAGCPEGTTCVGKQFGATGQCSFPADGDACWSDAECGPGKFCKGVYVCSPCVPCQPGKVEAPGTCVAK